MATQKPLVLTGDVIQEMAPTDAVSAATSLKNIVMNMSGTTMALGSAVYVSSANGDNPVVSLSQANAEATSSKTIGLLETAITTGGSGNVIQNGLIVGIDTSTATIGDPVWLSPTTAGGLLYGLANKPSAPNHAVLVGFVLNASTTAGRIFVKISNGWELEELHNVSLVSPANNDVLTYESTTGLWKNKPSSGGGGGASFEVGEVMLATNTPTTGTWLETDKYYSKATYPALASEVGDIVDFGPFVAVPQAQLPQPFATPNLSTTSYLCATDGTTYVAVGQAGAIRKSTDGVNWIGVPSTTTNQLNEIRYLNSKFIAVGAGSTVVYSTDGTNWVNSSSTLLTSSGSAQTFYSVAYGAGVYVVVAATTGDIEYSSDLITWNRITVSAGRTFYRVIFANGLFVVVGTSGSCFTSPDGITWTSRSAGANQFLDVIYANSLFVAVGVAGACYTSANGITWTSRSAGSVQLNSIVYGNSLYVAVGSSNTIYTSTDGITWTFRYSVFSSLYSVVWNGTTFVVGGIFGGYLTSTDGLTWTPAQDVSNSTFNSVAMVNGKTIGFGLNSSVILAGATRQEVMQSGTWAYTVSAQNTNNPRTIAYNGTNLYVAAGSFGVILTSPDGQTWTGRTTGSGANLDKVSYVNENWIAMGGGGSSNLLTSPDGITWTARTAGTTTLNYAAYGAGVYVVVGANGAVYSSPNLVTWTSRSAGANNFYDVIYANGLFVAVGVNNSVYSSADGITWTLRTATGTFHRIIYSNGLFVAIGNSGIIYTSADGITWTARTSGVSAILYDIVWNGSLFVAVGASGSIVSSSDGITWTNRTPGDTTVTLLSVSWSGTRFIATNSTNCVAWTSTDGITWSRSATAYYSPTTNTILYSAYLGGKFIAVGSGQIQTSTDGLNWVNCDHVQYVPSALSRTYKYGGMYYALSTTAGIYQSSDGISWSAARTLPNRPFTSMAYNGSSWVAITGASNGMPISVYKSTDGATWTKTVDFGALTSTSTVPSAFLDIEYANGNYVILCPFTATQGIVYNLYTSSEGVSWTGRLTPSIGIFSNTIASDGTTLVVGNSTSYLLKSIDGGVTWANIPITSVASPVYSNGVWLFANTGKSKDLSTFNFGATVGCNYVSGNYITGKTSGVVPFTRVNGNSIAYSIGNTNNYAVYSIVITNKPLDIRGTIALVPVTRNENISPNLLAECSLYSYDTSTTFFVPPSSVGGGQTAYIYAGV